MDFDQFSMSFLIIGYAFSQNLKAWNPEDKNPEESYPT